MILYNLHGSDDIIQNAQQNLTKYCGTKCVNVISGSMIPM